MMLEMLCTVRMKHGKHFVVIQVQSNVTLIHKIGAIFNLDTF